MTSLPHHANRTELRRSLVEVSENDLDPSRPADRLTAVLGSAYAYNLAAAIRWVELNVSEAAADGLAAWLSESLTNGDDTGMNDDLEAGQ